MRNPFRGLLRRPEQRNFDLPFDADGGTVRPSSMTVDRALGLAPVYAAGRLLASSVASLPLQTYRKVGERRERVPTPSLFDDPSAQGTLHDWLWRGVTSLAYRGNAVGLITHRGYDEHATAVEWLNPDEIQVGDSQPYGPGSYERPIWYWRGRPISAEDLVHIPWFTLPGRVWGLSPLAAYAAAVSVGLSAQDFSKDWFDSGGVPPGTFANSSETVDQQQATVIKKRLVQSIRSREPIVYGKDWTYNPITVSSNEAKFVDTMRLTATQVASIYGIPPEMIGGDTGRSMTYSNTEQQAINFVQFTLLPWLTKLESHLSVLLPRGQYVKFNVDALIRPDASTRYANYATARNIGLMSIDEIRALEDLPPLPGSEGQTHTPLTLLEKGRFGSAERSSEDEAGKALAWAEEQRLNSLEQYWKHGEGAAKIRWGTPGSWTRCHRQLTEHVGSERAKRICAQWHKDMEGKWPGEHHSFDPVGLAGQEHVNGSR